jgi:hypothetical protein
VVTDAAPAATATAPQHDAARSERARRGAGIRPLSTLS